MSVIVTAPPYTTMLADFIEGETISELVQRIKDDQQLEFRGTWTMQDTQDAGRVVGADEIVMDGRIYNMTVAIAS